MLAIACRLALHVKKLCRVGYRIEDDDGGCRELQGQYGLLARRQLDRVEGNVLDQPAERLDVGEVDSRAKEDLMIEIPNRKGVGIMRGDLADTRVHREGDFDRLVECRLVPGGTECAIVAVPIDGIQRRVGFEHAAATYAENIPLEFEKPAPCRAPKRTIVTLLIM